MLDHAGPYWITLNHTGSRWAILVTLDHTGARWTILDHAELSELKQEHKDKKWRYPGEITHFN
ncbi:hypothetical protein [Paenibacillus macerans]|uniref:hypothetical protein n=1 Tax=Paenibacillus macerans TaxID=44252 RepID=UPI00056455DF|nr:hypothetical protein [Paenibacillus macerans]MCY7559189.1 hypothetical protein [Paenibacillus macerans]MEC0149353.1 hypothetical protein [Paenibacillus macerans]